MKLLGLAWSRSHSHPCHPLPGRWLRARHGEIAPTASVLNGKCNAMHMHMHCPTDAPCLMLSRALCSHRRMAPTLAKSHNNSRQPAAVPNRAGTLTSAQAAPLLRTMQHVRWKQQPQVQKPATSECVSGPHVRPQQVDHAFVTRASGGHAEGGAARGECEEQQQVRARVCQLAVSTRPVPAHAVLMLLEQVCKHVSMPLC